MLRHIIVPRLARAVLLSVTLAAAAQAQNQPVAFVHGLFMGSGEWQGTANLLAQQYQIQAFVPTLGWGNSFETQANNLQGALGTLMQVAALGHSNGGLVERQYVQQFGAGTRLNRGFTLGTPHRGAQLAQFVRDGTAGRYGSYLFTSIVDPFDFYYYNDPDFQHAVDVGTLYTARVLMQFMAFAANYFVPIITQVAVPAVTSTIPVGAEMPPASAFIAALNSAGNLSAEQANMPTRVSAATSVSPQNAFFTLFSNSPDSWGQVRIGVEYYALLLYDHYSTHPDFFLQSNAWRWLNLAEAMASFDPVWHYLIGSFVGVTASGAVVVQHQDGLVPLSSQTWPGGTLQVNRLFPTYVIPHRSQVTHPVMIQVMKDVLGAQFGIPLRPPPVTASITGTNLISSAGTYTWSASPGGGTGPYAYQWSYSETGSWVNLGTAQTQSRSISSTTPDFSLKVVVTDPTGSGSYTVFVDNSLNDPPDPGGGCGPCSPQCKC